MDSLKQNLKSLIGINMEERKEAEIEIIRLRDQYPNQYAHKLLELSNEKDLLFISVVLLKNLREMGWVQLSKEIQEQITQFLQNLKDKNQPQNFIEN